MFAEELQLDEEMERAARAVDYGRTVDAIRYFGMAFAVVLTVALAISGCGA